MAPRSKASWMVRSTTASAAASSSFVGSTHHLSRVMVPDHVGIGSAHVGAVPDQATGDGPGWKLPVVPRVRTASPSSRTRLR
jgi:hypothetical protein